MQYKYKVTRRIVNSAIQLIKATEKLYNPDDELTKEMLRQVMPDFTKERKEGYHNMLKELIETCYTMLNNPIRFKK
jgi:hypothetical protein